MSKTICIRVLVFLALLGCFPVGLASAADEGTASWGTTYVIPPITDEPVLPDTTIPDALISDDISLFASPGEYEPASFVVRAHKDIEFLSIVTTDLTGKSAIITTANIDIRVVKCWYQGGNGGTDTSDFHRTNQRAFTPELLLKDDSLVKIENGENYIRVDGDYVQISSPNGISGVSAVPSVLGFPVEDTPTLQPVSILANSNKQFWITAHVPEGTPPGTYVGTITLETIDEVAMKLRLSVEVLPIRLLPPLLTYSLYYRGRLTSDGAGSISHAAKSEAQFRAELQDLAAHGVSNPLVCQSWDNAELFARYLQIRKEVGMDMSPLLLFGKERNLGYGNTSDPSQLEKLRAEAAKVIEIAEAEGYSDIYFYGIDEAKADVLVSQRPAWEAIHEAGGKVFSAGYTAAKHPPGNFDLVGDVQDLINCAFTPQREEAAKWHSNGHKIFCYANPQAGLEKPEPYRRNFGLVLWQADYDGAMNWAYQYGYGSIWNDFDYATSRDRAFAYPTANGVIDTIQWEGWREGVDDVRYLTTLIETIEAAKARGRDTMGAKMWLADLKQSDLSGRDLNQVRIEIIDRILALQGEDDELLLVENSMKPVNSSVRSIPITGVTGNTSPGEQSVGYLGLRDSTGKVHWGSETVSILAESGGSTYMNEENAGGMVTEAVSDQASSLAMPADRPSLIPLVLCGLAIINGGFVSFILIRRRRSSGSPPNRMIS